MALKYSSVHRTSVATSLITDVGTSGQLKLYTGTRPTTVDTALSGNTLLATLTCNATAFGAASTGVMTAGAIGSATAVATGTATFFRLFKSDGTTAVIDGDVAASGSDLNLAGGPGITSGQTVSVSSFVITTFGA
jgi:hypothetical protein